MCDIALLTERIFVSLAYAINIVLLRSTEYYSTTSTG